MYLRCCNRRGKYPFVVLNVRKGQFEGNLNWRDVTLEQANQHARNVGLQLLAALREAAGSLDKVVCFGRVFGMVNAVPEFTDHPKVINGCSDLFVEVFGDRGRHARCAVGIGSLPFNMTVEIEVVVEVT
jgi:enamine deaminase RidA (YjgF/YER057c/UK114 family)